MKVEWPDYVAKVYTEAGNAVGSVPKRALEMRYQRQEAWDWFCQKVLEDLQHEDPEEGFTAQMESWSSWIKGKNASTVHVELSEAFIDIVRRIQKVRQLDDSTASQFVLFQLILIDRNELP